MTLMIIFLLLYLNFRRIAQTLIAMLSLPFALVGGLSSKAGIYHPTRRCGRDT